MFIDTHCHLVGKDGVQADIKKTIENAKHKNVSMMICSSAQDSDIPEIIKIINTHDEIFATMGIHPAYAHEVKNAVQFLGPDILNHPKVLGVGEIGMDYHYGDEYKHQQMKIFDEQVNIAKEYNLPVIIHTRDAEKDTYEILKNTHNGVMHCYTGTWEFAKKMLDNGFYFSASGVITFAKELQDVFKKIPTNHLVIETDAPWLAPVPFRGKNSEPAMVIETAKVLADIKNLHLDELETILEENTKRLFPKWQDR